MPVYKLMRHGVKRLSDGLVIIRDRYPDEWAEYENWRRHGQWVKVLQADGRSLDIWVGNIPDPADPDPPQTPIIPPIGDPREARMRRDKQISRQLNKSTRRGLE